MRSSWLLIAIWHLSPLIPPSAAEVGAHNGAHSQLTLGTDDQKSPIARPSLRHEASDYAFATRVASYDPLQDLRKALDVMQRAWFEVWIGTWPSAIDWTRAVVDTHLLSSLSTLSKALHGLRDDEAPCRSGGTEIENEINGYFAQNVAYYFGEDALSLRYQAYDDMLWVVLGWLESIKFIRSHSNRHYQPVNDTNSWHGSQFITAFAHRARIFYEITTRGWDTELCGGGMTWNPSLAPYKNAITNELFISASVGMYLYFPGDRNTAPFMMDGLKQTDLEPVEPHDPEYLKAAVDGYDWLKNSKMTNEKGLYTDGFHIRNWRNGGTECNVRNEMVYTYNQGVILSGLRGLWESTGNTTYLEDAHQLVRDTIQATGWSLDSQRVSDSDTWAGLGRRGILEDRCDAQGQCSQDAQTFKGIYFHHLTLLCEPLPREPVVPGHTHSADPDLAFLHHGSCQEYAPWVAHNANGAIRARDENGKFGTWWGAQYGEVDSKALPEGAVDYRNNESQLLNLQWQDTNGDDWSTAVSSTRGRNLLTADAAVDIDNLAIQQDLNDRGRGRTVETQSGGVAVLRALWELRNMN